MTHYYSNNSLLLTGNNDVITCVLIRWSWYVIMTDRQTDRHVSFITMIIPSVKRQVFCVGDRLKMDKHKAWASTIVAPKLVGSSTTKGQMKPTFWVSLTVSQRKFHFTWKISRLWLDFIRLDKPSGFFRNLSTLNSEMDEVLVKFLT